MAEKGKWTRQQAEKAYKKLLKSLENYEKIELCGSFRRNCDYVGDLDLVVVSHNPAKFYESAVSIAHQVLAAGGRNIRILLKNGIQVDFVIVDEENFESAILHSTGSKNFNIKCRAVAKIMGLKLSEYGLRDMATNKKVATTEDGILECLKLAQFKNPVTRSL